MTIIGEFAFYEFVILKKLRIFTNFKTRNEFYFLHFRVLTHQSTAFFTRCKLKLRGSPYHYSGTNLCRLSAVKVGLYRPKFT